MVGFLKRCWFWWNRKSKKKYYYWKPERVFRRNKLEIAVRLITRPFPNPWLALIMSPKIVLMKANWRITEEEINERSPHPLSREIKKINPKTEDLRKLKFLGFSIYRNSVMIEPLTGKSTRKLWRLIKEVTDILFEWEILQKKTANLIHAE